MNQFDCLYGERDVQGGPRLAFDIETNGLLPDVDKTHSLVITDIDAGTTWSCHDNYEDEKWTYGTECMAPTGPSIDFGLDLLTNASVVFGHNIIGYDIPVLKHIYPWWEPKFVARDTLLLAKLIWPVDNLKQLDFPRWRRGVLPGQLIGAHKLEAWGYRLGLQKGEYSKTVKELSKEYSQHGDLSKIPEDYHVLVSTNARGQPCLNEWQAWNQPMQDYCETDVEVTCALLKLIEGHLSGTTSAAKGVGWDPRCVKLEHDVWEHCLKQEKHGFGYDLEKAIELTATLKTTQRRLEKELREVFGAWWQPLSDPQRGEKPARSRNEKATEFPDVRLKRISEKTGKPLKDYVGPPMRRYDENSPFVRVKWIEFNPKSRQHLGERLQAVFGWKPVEFGGKDGKQAKVDETTIKAIEPEVLPSELKDTILEYLVVSKTLGQLADGRKSWNDLCDENQVMHGRVDPLGTISHRAAHKDPNLGQVPAVSIEEKKDDDGNVIDKRVIMGWKGGFGAECRSLFRPTNRKFVQSGTDASGLQLRLLGHYLYPYDEGTFAKRVSTPGLDIHGEHGRIIELPRAETKTTTYAWIFGAGLLKLGLGVGVKDDEIEALVSSRSASSYVGWLKRTRQVVPDRKTLAYIMKGQQVKKKLLAGITGLKDLQKDITEEGKTNGFIIGLDGRKLGIRKPHATLNQALQGGESVVCKTWMIRMDILLQDAGLKPEVDYGQMGWVHDELQFEHRPGLEEVTAETSELAMKQTADQLNFRGELSTDSKSGSNWMDCH